jgi:hypothetical protein
MNPSYQNLFQVIMKTADRGDDVRADLEGYAEVLIQLANDSRELFLQETALLALTPTPKITVCGKWKISRIIEVRCLSIHFLLLIFKAISMDSFVIYCGS